MSRLTLSSLMPRSSLIPDRRSGLRYPPASPAAIAEARGLSTAATLRRAAAACDHQGGHILASISSAMITALAGLTTASSSGSSGWRPGPFFSWIMIYGLSSFAGHLLDVVMKYGEDTAVELHAFDDIQLGLRVYSRLLDVITPSLPTISIDLASCRRSSAIAVGRARSVPADCPADVVTFMER